MQICLQDQKLWIGSSAQALCGTQKEIWPFGNGKNSVIAVPLPDKALPSRHTPANLLVTGASDTPFGESLLWFTDWGVAASQQPRRLQVASVNALRHKTSFEAPARNCCPS